MQIFGAVSDPDKWDTVVSGLPEPLRDVHFTSAYGRVQEADNEGRAILAVQEFGGSFVAQPFLMRAVPSGDASSAIKYYDLTNLYGFGGPVSNISPAFGQKYGHIFSEELKRWARTANVVSEYCVLHPLMTGQQLPFVVHENVLWTKQVVVINELKTFKESGCSRTVQRAIKKAGRYIVTECPDHFTFASLYETSMDRLKAPQRWRHFGAYWIAHKHEDIGAKWYFIPGHRSLLVIGKGKTAYAHFLGSDGKCTRDGLDARLYFDAAQDLAKQGFERFHLGGGLTEREDDSLLAFKSGFSKDRYSVGTYRRVFMPDVYEKLPVKDRNWFPQYRSP